MKIKVENHSNLFRDSETGAIVNTNYTEYKNYMNSLKYKKRELNRIDMLENNVNSLKDDIQEIKDLLKCLIKE
jgi:predicted transcriptional regulator